MSGEIFLNALKENASPLERNIFVSDARQHKERPEAISGIFCDIYRRFLCNNSCLPQDKEAWTFKSIASNWNKMKTFETFIETLQVKSLGI